MQKYTLSNASPGIKIITTIFLLFMVPGLTTNLLIVYSKTGWSYDGLIEYYKGVESGYAKSYMELLETTHFHIFSMPVVFLILAHIFLMCSWGYRTKIAVIVISFLAIFAEICSPWLITYVSPKFALLMIFSGISISLNLLIYTVVPLYEMWFVKFNNGSIRNST
ncbi:MAG: hypothetical protein L0Y68_05400 [Candidatus Dadabacteria bacterium]|nr:hypothetical protein [Candidatus Dadabacteria bacterium]